MNRAEAYYAVMVVDAPGMSAGKIRQLRYFVLEYVAMQKGQLRTYLAEWSPKDSEDLEYHIHAEDIPPSIPEVLKKIDSLLPKKL
jgi:hypothetical protein